MNNIRLSNVRDIVYDTVSSKTVINGQTVFHNNLTVDSGLFVGYPKLAIVTHKTAYNVNGGTAVNDAWNRRPFTNIDKDDIGITLASNTVTVPPGTYRIFACATTYTSDNTVIQLDDVGMNTMIDLGFSGYSGSSSILSHLETIFVAASATQLGLHSYITSGGNHNHSFGIAHNIVGFQNKYAALLITQLR
jgi:hypothetical protein